MIIYRNRLMIITAYVLASIMLPGCIFQEVPSTTSPRVLTTQSLTQQASTTPTTSSPLPTINTPIPTHLFPSPQVLIPTTTPTMLPDLIGRIAFVRTGDGTDDILIMDADGSDIRHLTDQGSFNSTPAWSPAGDEIAYASDLTFGGNFDLYLMSVDGSVTTQLTNDLNAWEDQPTWSPDGKSIAFTIHFWDEIRNSDIFVIDRFGGNRIRLTNTPLSEEYPAWSPSNDVIGFLYKEEADSSSYYIYTMRLDGSGRSKLSNLRARGPLAWSPDGKQIAFATPKGDGWDLYILNADGSGGHYLTNEAEPHNSNPTWSPDGKYIAFKSSRDGSGCIYVIGIDGLGLARLTHNPGPGMDFHPTWSP